MSKKKIALVCGGAVLVGAFLIPSNATVTATVVPPAGLDVAMDGLTAVVEQENAHPDREHGNAVGSAQDYLRFGQFSRKGLVDQLTFEEYTPEQAEYAVAYLESTGGVDWNEVARDHAESYLSNGNFSRQQLLDQLVFEEYTPEQAEQAVDAVY